MAIEEVTEAGWYRTTYGYACLFPKATFTTAKWWSWHGIEIARINSDVGGSLTVSPGEWGKDGAPRGVWGRLIEKAETVPVDVLEIFVPSSLLVRSILFHSEELGESP